MKNTMRIILILIVLAWAMAAMAALAGPPGPADSASWNEHADLMTIIIGGLIALVLFFMLRTLTKIDRNQNRLFEKLDAVCKQVDMLQGEHNVMKELCAGRVKKPERPD